MGEYVYRQPLLTRKGKLATPGWSPEDIFTYNKENLAFPFRRREWEFYQISDPRFAFRVSYAHGPGAGRAEAVLVDFETGEKVRSGKLQTFPGDGIDLDFAPGEPHGVKYEDKSLLLSFGCDEERRRVVVRSDRFDAEIIAPETGDAMVTAFPFERRQFLYQFKKIYPRLQGHIHMHKLDYPLDEGAVMVLSSGRGVMPYRTRRIWGAGAISTPKGWLAVNIGEDYGPEDVSTENALFVDGCLDKLGRVYFKYDHENLLHTWRLSDGGRRLGLEFSPVYEDVDKVNFLAAEIKRHRLFGRINGLLKLSDDTEITVEDQHFFIELADDRW